MTPFSKQGESASSCHPFAEWCDANKVNVSTMNYAYRSDELQRAQWNIALIATQNSDFASADAAIEQLRLLERKTID